MKIILVSSRELLKVHIFIEMNVRLCKKEVHKGVHEFFYFFIFYAFSGQIFNII